MDPPIPALVTTREEALTLMDRNFETVDPGVFAAMVRATTDAEDAAVFGIVRGSENEMDLLNKAMYLLRERAITPCWTRWPSSPGESDPNRQGCLTAPDH